MGGHRLTVTESQLRVLVDALREALAADLLRPASIDSARQMLELLDAKLPSAIDHHPAGRVAGRLIAGDEILRLLLAREDRYGYAALGREQIAGELDWKPAGVSVRELLDELRRTGWLTARRQGAERLYGLTGKGRGRARERATAGHLWHPAVEPSEKHYPGRRRILFAFEADIHAGVLEALRVPGYPPGNPGRRGQLAETRRVRLPGPKRAEHPRPDRPAQTNSSVEMEVRRA